MPEDHPFGGPEGKSSWGLVGGNMKIWGLGVDFGGKGSKVVETPFLGV